MALTKIINDENKDYRPVLTDKLVLDAKPTVNSFNAITSDAVARAVAGASGEVPQVTENDNGKVLGAIYDAGGAAVEWIEPPAALPDMTGNDGKVLGAVDNSGTMEAQWVDPPEYTAGVGIDIDNTTVAAKVGNGLSIGNSTKTVYVTEPKYATALTDGPSFIYVNYAIPLTSDIVTAIDNGETINVVVPRYVEPNTTNEARFFETNRYVIGARNDTSNKCAPLSAPSAIYYGTFTLNKSNMPPDYLSNWDSIKASNTSILALIGCPSTSFNGLPGFSVVSALGDYHVFDIAMPEPVVIQNAINVSNPLPSTLGTAGQLLAVNSGGTGVEWANAPSSDVVVITLTAEPTGTALADFYNQVSTAVAANKQVVVKTINTEGIMYYELTDIEILGATEANYAFNCTLILDSTGSTKDMYVFRMRLDYRNTGSPSYNLGFTRVTIASGVPSSPFNPFGA